MASILKISEAASMGMHAVMYLGSNPGQRYSAREIALIMDVSEAHLSKVMQRLVKGGYLESVRGPGGGFILAKGSSDVTLLDIFEVIEGPYKFNECILGSAICGDRSCIFGDLLVKVTEMVRGYLRETKIISTPKSMGGRKIMKRKVVQINEEKCDGCGLCIPSCAEGALRIVDGKARLVSDVYCDGLGACLGECPQDAIIIVEREAEEFDEEAVKQHLARQARESVETSSEVTQGAGEQASVCPSVRLMNLGEEKSVIAGEVEKRAPGISKLGHWPIKLKLVPPGAPFLDASDLVLIADCVPFAYPDVHERFLDGHSVVIGCPKFDDGEADLERLTGILKHSDIRSITVVHMEVPCCHGYIYLGREALKVSGKNIPIRQVIVGVQGSIKVEEDKPVIPTKSGSSQN